MAAYSEEKNRQVVVAVIVARNWWGLRAVRFVWYQSIGTVAQAVDIVASLAVTLLQSFPFRPFENI
jgi:hypothetical protein